MESPLRLIWKLNELIQGAQTISIPGALSVSVILFTLSLSSMKYLIVSFITSKQLSSYVPTTYSSSLMKIQYTQIERKNSIFISFLNKHHYLLMRCMCLPFVSAPWYLRPQLEGLKDREWESPGCTLAVGRSLSGAVSHIIYVWPGLTHRMVASNILHCGSEPHSRVSKENQMETFISYYLPSEITRILLTIDTSYFSSGYFSSIEFDTVMLFT